MKPQYAWRKLSAAKWEDAWLERLSEFIDRLAITALAGRKTIRLEVFALTKAQAQRLEQGFGGQVSEMRKAHALAAMPPRQPIKVREKLVVVATERERAKLSTTMPGRKILLIPAGMAFGTGDHATTATCLRFLADVSEDFAGRGWEMLDLGCGSGILALAGRMLGARRAEAGDFDPDAVRVAKENVRLNGLRGVVVKRLDVRDWKPPRTWDVVVANIYSGILVEVAPTIAASVAPGGRLVFSGILREQEAEVLAAFRKAGLRIDRIVRKTKWVTGLATRS